MKRAKLNNAGSTFIIVIIAVSFMMVLGTIMLAATAANVTSKQIEYAAKQSFYTDERVLDDIFHGIGRVADEYLTLAYSEVLGEVSSSGSSGLSNQLAAFGAFAGDFISRVADRYGLNGMTPTVTPTGSKTYAETLAALNSYIATSANAAETNVRVTKFDGIEIVLDPTLPVLYDDGTIKDPDFETAPQITDPNLYHPYQYVFRGVEVHYVVMVETSPGVWYDPGYESVITTDIVIEVPYIQFFQATSSIFDYALVGVEGLYFQSGSLTTVKGNVYAGVSDTAKTGDSAEQLPGGLNIQSGANAKFESALVISKGDINVKGSGTSLTVGSISDRASMELWTESLRILGAVSGTGRVDVSIDGQMYVANDLEINGDGDQKLVQLSGSYFGYSDLGYASFESQVGNVTSKYAASSSSVTGVYDEHTRSSSMIINGKNGKLDLRNLDVLVVAGLAYVDLRNAVTDINVEEYPTGESIALRSNQYMYLVPSDLLNYPNPYHQETTGAGEVGMWNPNPPGGAGAGFYADIGGLLDGSKATWRKMQAGSNTYLYYFFDIASNKRRDFAELVLNMKETYYEDGPLVAPYNSTYGSNAFLQQLNGVKTRVNERFAGSGNEIYYNDATLFYTGGAMTKTHYYDAVADEWKAIGAPDYLETYQPVNTLSYADFVGTIASLQGASALEPGSLEQFYIYLYERLDPLNSYARTSSITALVPKTLDENLRGPNFRYPMGYYVTINPTPGGPSALVGAGTYLTSYLDSSHNTWINPTGPIGGSGQTLSGIVIADGDVTIAAGTNFSGLILATGRIYVGPGATITANRAAIQAIIDEEIREESKRPAGSPANEGYAITYLSEIDVNRTGFDMTERIDSTDYTSYISYARWRKGQVNP